MFITFKEILEYSLENCLSLAALIREGENYYHELLEANWVSDGMWWGKGWHWLLESLGLWSKQRSPFLILMAFYIVFSFTGFPRFLSLSYKLLLD